MGLLSIVLIILGILMLIEGITIIFFTKFTLTVSRKFVKFIEKHLKTWGIAEIIIAIILIILGLRL